MALATPGPLAGTRSVRTAEPGAAEPAVAERPRAEPEPGVPEAERALEARRSEEPGPEGLGETRGPGISWAATLAEAVETAQKAQKPLLVDFGADWCGYCKKLDRETFGDETVIRFVEQHFVAVKVDTVKEPLVARKYAVSGLPTVLFLAPSGAEVRRVVGFRPPDVFLKEAQASVTSAASLAKLKEEAEKSPGDLQAQRAYARALFVAGHLETARDLLQKTLEAQGDDPAARAAVLLDLGDALRLSGKLAEARDAYLQLLEIPPAAAGAERRKALLPLAWVLVSTTDPSAAVPFLDELLRAQEEPPEQRLEGLFLRAYVHAVEKDVDGAMADLKAARESDPEGRWGLRAGWILEAARAD